MKRMKLLIIFLTIFLFNDCNVFAQSAQYSRVVHYNVKMENVAWYQKVALFFLGLDWDTISIKTTFLKDEAGTEKVIAVTAWADNPETSEPEESEIAFNLNQSTETAESFIEFLKYTKFKTEEVPKLMALYNYLYDENISEVSFQTTNLFEKENGNMNCKFSKQKKEGKNLVSIVTLNSSGAVNGNVEVSMNPSPEKHLDRIYAKLKVGIEITLTPIQEKKPD